MFSLCLISDFNLTVDVEIRVTGCLFLFETFTFPNFSDLTREGCVIWLHVIDSAGNISKQATTVIRCLLKFHSVLTDALNDITSSFANELSQVQHEKSHKYRNHLITKNCSKLRRRLRGLKRKGFFWATKVPASSIS